MKKKMLFPTNKESLVIGLRKYKFPTEVLLLSEKYAVTTLPTPCSVSQSPSLKPVYKSVYLSYAAFGGS